MSYHIHGYRFRRPPVVSCRRAWAAGTAAIEGARQGAGSTLPSEPPLEENPNGGHASQGPGGHHPHVNSVGRYRWPGGPAVLPRIRHLPVDGARDLRGDRLSPPARPSHPAGRWVRGGAGARLGVAGPAVMDDAAGGAASSASAPRRGAAGGREPRAPGAVGRGSRAPDAVGRGSRAPDAVGRGSRAPDAV